MYKLQHGQLSLTEAAEVIGCSRMQIHRLIKRGLLKKRESATGAPYIRRGDAEALAARYTPEKGRPPAEASPGFGAEVRAARERRGWTQEDLAAEAGFDHRQVITKIEAGAYNIRLSDVLALLAGLECQLTGEGELVD